MIASCSINLSDSSISLEVLLRHLEDNCTLFVEINGADKSLLIEINRRLKDLKNVGLILVCDYLRHPSSGYVNNLEVLHFLNNIQRLIISNNSSERLEKLDNIGYITELKEFSLNGFFRDNINLESLCSYQLESLSIESKATEQIYMLLCHTRCLKELSINSLDLNKIEALEDLTYLSVNNTLLTPDIMSYRFPNLKSLQMKLAKRISDFSFLSSLHNLSNLSLMYTGITSIPTLNVDMMKRISLVSNKRLRDISSIWKLQSLEQLYISYSDLLKTEDLDKCLKVPNMKRACFLSTKFKKEKEIKEIFEHSKVEFNISTANDFHWF